MNRLQKLLLIPFLAPFFSLLLIGLINTSKTTKLRVLIWETKTINIGLLISAGSATGFLYGITMSLAFTNTEVTKRRKLVINKPESAPSEEQIDNQYNEVNQANLEMYLERDYKDPKPTLEVPFRIIKKDDLPRKNRKSNQNTTNNESAMKQQQFQNKNLSTIVEEARESIPDDWSINLDETW